MRYEYTDEVLNKIRTFVVEIFDRNRSLVSSDELNIIGNIVKMYENIQKQVVKTYLQLAKHYYRSFSKKKAPDEKWLMALLSEPNAVSRYSFTNELVRKRERLIESMAIGSDRNREYDKAMRLLNVMLSAYAIIVTDAAVIKAYKDSNVNRVRWIALMDDAKTCDTCKERHGKVYKIDEVPPKPHLHCRCWLEAVMH